MICLSIRKVLCCFLVVITLHKHAEATQCYICSTFLSAWCRDPFDLQSPIQPRNCSDEIVPQKHSNLAVIENIFQVLGSVGDDENGSGINDMRRRRFAEVVDRYKRDAADAAAVRERRQGSKPIKRKEPPKVIGDEEIVPLQDPGYKCFKLSMTGVRGTSEVFRGCLKYEAVDICGIVLQYNDKGQNSTNYCDTCNNKEGDFPNPDNAPPCNRAATWNTSGEVSLVSAILLMLIYSPY